MKLTVFMATLLLTSSVPALSKEGNGLLSQVASSISSATKTINEIGKDESKKKSKKKKRRNKKRRRKAKKQKREKSAQMEVDKRPVCSAVYGAVSESRNNFEEKEKMAIAHAKKVAKDFADAVNVSDITETPFVETAPKQAFDRLLKIYEEKLGMKSLVMNESTGYLADENGETILDGNEQKIINSINAKITFRGEDGQKAYVNVRMRNNNPNFSFYVNEKLPPYTISFDIDTPIAEDNQYIKMDSKLRVSSVLGLGGKTPGESKVISSRSKNVELEIKHAEYAKGPQKIDHEDFIGTESTKELIDDEHTPNCVINPLFADTEAKEAAEEVEENINNDLRNESKEAQEVISEAFGTKEKAAPLTKEEKKEQKRKIREQHRYERSLKLYKPRKKSSNR